MVGVDAQGTVANSGLGGTPCRERGIGTEGASYGARRVAVTLDEEDGNTRITAGMVPSAQVRAMPKHAMRCVFFGTQRQGGTAPEEAHAFAAMQHGTPFGHERGTKKWTGISGHVLTDKLVRGRSAKIRVKCYFACPPPLIQTDNRPPPHTHTPPSPHSFAPRTQTPSAGGRRLHRDMEQRPISLRPTDTPLLTVIANDLLIQAFSSSTLLGELALKSASSSSRSWEFCRWRCSRWSLFLPWRSQTP